MNTHEARSLLAEQLVRYQRRSYAALVAMIGTEECYEVSGSSGGRYQVEVQVVWDDKPYGAVRVIGSIDDGGVRAFLPLTQSFLLTSEG